MSSKATPNREAQPQLTAREMEILAMAWQCIEGGPKINYDKLAKLAPFKNVTTARACFTPIKKKLALASGELAAAQTGEPSTPTKGSGKRKAGAEKTPRSGKKAKASSKIHSGFEDDNDDEDVTHAKIKANIKADMEAEENEDAEGLA
ncbi:hypothetical protein Daesc_003733 [Daldinia eschscholtzii]|uniref:Uncharacterized protein n=1 Tax=Daldinia eschscholtzii TaxID=292717 RepID=A0AAX6MNK8_9PEZI